MLQTIKKHLNTVIDSKTQQDLNTPIQKNDPLEEGHDKFLKILTEKLKKGEIKPHLPDSLFNHQVYDNLSEEQQEKAGIVAINLLNIIRQIEILWNLEHIESFQIQNLVETVWQMKAKYEADHGDVFII